MSPWIGVKTKLAQNSPEIKKYTEHGGMPGIFAIRDPSNRAALFEAWIETTCTRDLAKRILMAIAQLPEPNAGEIAKEVRRLPRQIEKYLEAFISLFCITQIEPYKTSTGKPLYLLFDSGIAHHSGSDPHRRLQIWFLNECFSQYSYAGLPAPSVFYYQTSKGARIDFVVTDKNQTYAVQLTELESPTTYSLRAIESFAQKHPKVPSFVLTPSLKIHSHRFGIKLVPWTSVI